MKVFQEITAWEDTTPNHIYFMDDGKSKAYAYLPVGKKNIFEFKAPLKLDVRGRKFKEVTNTWGFFPREELKMVSQSWTVTGSKGDTYTVTEEDGQLTCSCAGFRFRGACKHAVKKSQG
jgi:hypothetical protein